MRVVAILETMWDWRGRTSGAGYCEAPRYFRINPQNYSGKRLYKLVGPNARLLVTNACRELAKSAKDHGIPDPHWLAENLKIINGDIEDPDENIKSTQRIDVLLVCGKVAQATYKNCGYTPAQARVIEMPHPAARVYWTRHNIAMMAQRIQHG